MKYLLLITLISLTLGRCDLYAQYQVPLYAPGNASGESYNGSFVVLSVAGQNATGINQNQEYKAYYGLLSPISIELTGMDKRYTGLFSLGQNFPNPFRIKTSIPFSLSRSSDITLVVKDILGRPIKILLNREMPPGNHQVECDASDLAPGIYFYQLQLDGVFLTRNMVIGK